MCLADSLSAVCARAGYVGARREVPLLSLRTYRHIELSFFYVLGTYRVILLVRAVKLAKFSYTLRKTINLGESWSFCNLLSFTPSFPSKKVLSDVKICRLRSGGALSVLYWYNWGPRPYHLDVHED